jgi:hypothetical protein
LPAASVGYRPYSVNLGYAISSEEHRPLDLVRHAQRAEQAGEFVDAGFDHVHVHQVGPDQEGFLDFYEREILPAVESLKAGSTAEEARA